MTNWNNLKPPRNRKIRTSYISLSVLLPLVACFLLRADGFLGWVRVVVEMCGPWRGLGGPRGAWRLPGFFRVAKSRAGGLKQGLVLVSPRRLWIELQSASGCLSSGEYWLQLSSGCCDLWPSLCAVCVDVFTELFKCMKNASLEVLVTKKRLNSLWCFEITWHIVCFWASERKTTLQSRKWMKWIQLFLW